MRKILCLTVILTLLALFVACGHVGVSGHGSSGGGGGGTGTVGTSF